MEKESRAVYYVTTGEGKLKIREKLPVYHCDRTLSYPGGEIHVFFSFLPDGLEEEFRKKRKRRKREQQLLEAMERVTGWMNGTTEILFSDNLCRLFDREQSASDELYAAWLFQKLKGRSAPHFSLELPEEYGFLMREKVLFLLQPYLKRINRITFITKRWSLDVGDAESMSAMETVVPGISEKTAVSGSAGGVEKTAVLRAAKEMAAEETGAFVTENEVTEELADYFYEEYGILSGYAEKPEAGSFYLKLSNDAEILNFLDTAVKSGYNTKVD